jgi:hypothetical protein
MGVELYNIFFDFDIAVVWNLLALVQPRGV